MDRSKNTISYELKFYKHIKRYHPKKAYERYLINRRNCKKHIVLTVDQIKWLNQNFNHLHYTPEIICKLYKIEFYNKFPMCFKTLYNYIYLGLFNLNKKIYIFMVKEEK